MRKKDSFLFITIFIGIVLSCTHQSNFNRSEFLWNKDYKEFSSKMQHKDTLNIGVNLSICMWREYHQLQITKSNDSLFLQLKEMNLANEAALTFDKIHYLPEKYSFNLEKLLTEFDTIPQTEQNSPFFLIFNSTNNDTLLLRTGGLASRNLSIEKYRNFMKKLYPDAFETDDFITPPPPPPSKGKRF